MRVVWLADVLWDGLRTRQHQLVLRLPDDWRVLFVEPLVPRNVARGALRRRNVAVTAVSPLPGLSLPGARRLLAWPAARRLDTWLAGRWLRREALRLLGGYPDVVVTSSVHFAPALRHLRPGLVVYDCCDDPTAFPTALPWAGADFAATVAQADLVVCSASRLLELVHAAGARWSLLLGNGVDVAHFERPRAEPPELRELPRPIVGYVGHVAAWLDVAAVAAAARALPEASFVLIGPVDLASADRRALALPNVHLLGPRPYDALPGYVQRFAVGLVPFRRSELTRAVDPNKLYEYAACNLPIVATPFSPEVAAASPPITLASDPQAFAQAVAARLADPGPPTRPLAEGRSWDDAAAHLARVLAELRGEWLATPGTVRPS